MQVVPDTTLTCPRCGASVSVEFRFCPECAYRVQGGTLPHVAPGRNSALPYVLVGLGAIALIGGFVLAGIALFRPGAPREITRTPQTPVELTNDPILRLGESFVDVEAAYSEYAPNRDSTGRLIWDPESRDLPVFVETMTMMRYEVSGDQYAAFLSSITEIEDVEAIIDLEEEYRDLFAPSQETLREMEEARTSGAPPGFAEGYLQIWWDALRSHLGDQAPDERPEWLRVPIAPQYAALLFAPTHWISRSGIGTLAWALPNAPWEEELRAATLPVTNISLLEARAFSTWASRELGRTVYVPTGAQFRRAFRGRLPEKGEPDQRQWPWGNRTASWLFNSRAYWEGRRPRLLPVTHGYGTAVESARTPEKIKDLAGNAREWTQPERIHRPDGLAPDKPEYLIVTAIRDAQASTLGGSYLMGIEECTTEYYNLTDVRARAIDLGFRLVGNQPLKLDGFESDR